MTNVKNKNDRFLKRRVEVSDCFTEPALQQICIQAKRIYL
jgi:hypothetical protein